MDRQEKWNIINEAYEKYAEKIKSLEYISDNDSIYSSTRCKDGLSIFYPHHIKEIDAEMSSGKTLTLTQRIKLNNERKSADFLYGFKWRGDEHVGYILDRFIRNEPVLLKSGKTSKKKTYLESYAVVASYNFYSGNVEVNILTGSEIDSMEYLTEAKTPEDFYEAYKRFFEEAERLRRQQEMHITVGLWEDMQEQIRQLSERINELSNDLSDNYTRKYNSEEE